MKMGDNRGAWIPKGAQTRSEKILKVSTNNNLLRYKAMTTNGIAVTPRSFAK